MTMGDPTIQYTVPNTVCVHMSGEKMKIRVFCGNIHTSQISMFTFTRMPLPIIFQRCILLVNISVDYPRSFIVIAPHIKQFVFVSDNERVCGRILST